MEQFDLAIAYKWKYDVNFVKLIEEIFQKDKLRTFIIGLHNRDEIYYRVSINQLQFNFFLDRASDEDETFVPLANLIKSKRTRIINDYEKVESSVDKATIQPLLEKNNIKIPRTEIIEQYGKIKIPNYLRKIIRSFKKPFVIKPSYYSGGGDGVVVDGKSFDDVQRERMGNGDDRYLIQEFITPKLINGKRAWFRPLYAFGKVIILMWDDKTHIYDQITKEDEKLFDKKKLINTTKRLAKISGLDYFSTEIAIDKSDEYYVIDYINDQCDMRMKSEHLDGVPDESVIFFVECMKSFVRKKR